MTSMQRHLSGFGEGCIYKHKAYNQASYIYINTYSHPTTSSRICRAYTAICMLIQDATRIETLLLDILVEVNSIHDTSPHFAAYVCSIYRNIQHVWPHVFGNVVSFDVGAGVPPSTRLRNTISLLVRLAVAPAVDSDDWLRAAGTAVSRLYEVEGVPSSSDLVGFACAEAVRVGVCLGPNGGGWDHEARVACTLLHVYCRHISWNDA